MPGIRLLELDSLGEGIQGGVHSILISLRDVTLHWVTIIERPIGIANDRGHGKATATWTQSGQGTRQEDPPGNLRTPDR